MILGVGTDIIKICRIENSINRTRNFLSGIFSDDEIKYFNSKSNSLESIAGNFAAKEAISKALGTGFRSFRHKDIEVLRDDFGKPIVILSKKIEEKFKLTNYVIHLSISHTTEDAVAFAVLEVIDNCM